MIRTRGITHQFGATPKTGCQNGLFCLKSLLQTRREHEMDTYCVFIDLVKAYDSVQHEIIMLTLQKMGVPPKLCGTIKKLYSDFHVLLKVGKEERKIEMGCGVRQGDNLAPTLFILVMQVVSQVIQDEFDKNNIDSPVFHHNHNVSGPIRLHKQKTESSETDRLSQLLYVDDGALIFTNKSDTCIGIQIVIDIMCQFGLTVHAGQNNTKAKSEAVFFPCRSTIRKWKDNHKRSLLQCEAPTQTEELVPQKKEVFDLQLLYDTADETKPILLRDDCKIIFKKEFKYLGSWVSFQLTDQVDIKARISKASKALGALTFFWKLQMVDLRTKVLLYKAIPLNLLLWGAENWAQNSADIEKLERFHHKAIRRILGISMTQVRDERIKNDEVRKRFGGIASIKLIIAKKQLKWVGKIVRMDKKQIPPKILTGFIKKPRSTGRRFKTTRDGIFNNLQLLFPNLDTSGKLCQWKRFAFYEGYWDKCLTALINQSELPAFNEEEWRSYTHNSSRRGQGQNQRDEHNGENGDGTDWNSSERRNTVNNSEYSGNNSRNRSRENNSQYKPDTYATPQSPSFFLNMSHNHTVQTARRCFQIDSSATMREITVRYKRLARTYHPDKWHQNTGCTKTESTTIFQCISNAYVLLRRSMPR